MSIIHDSFLSIIRHSIMNREFEEINNSLNEDIYDECKIQFQRGQDNLDMEPLPVALLPHFLEKLKLSIP